MSVSVRQCCTHLIYLLPLAEQHISVVLLLKMEVIVKGIVVQEIHLFKKNKI
jgi:hypothetical protein